mgnify:CR=1 FL=1
MRTTRSKVYAEAASTEQSVAFAWIDTEGADGITINGWYGTEVFGQLVVQGSDDEGLTGPNDVSSIAPYSLPDGCLHSGTSGIALGVYTVDQGIPIELSSTGDGGLPSFVLSLKNFSRWLRLSFVWVSDGAVDDLYLRYTLRYPR